MTGSNRVETVPAKTKKGRTRTLVSARSQPKQLRELSPTEFENLVFDLVILRGATNVTWRTPGADGGRDIEGFVSHQDFSGGQLTEKWFIECKRYSSSVDWPTIYQKLAYADSHQADVLLMCTTSTFSVTAVTQTEAWNASTRRPKVRLWPRHELDVQLQLHPDLQVKYGLSDSGVMLGRSMMTIALALSKTLSSHYSRVIFREEEADRMLDAAQSFADLLLRRADDIERYGEVPAPQPFVLATALPQFATEDRIVRMDEPGLRAFVMYLAALAADKIKVEASASNACSIVSTTSIGSLVNRYLAVFSAIATWSNFEFQITQNGIQVIQRGSYESADRQ